MKKSVLLCLLLLLLLAAAGCGHREEQERFDDRVLSAAIDGVPCRTAGHKNYGGQETGMTFVLFIPRDKLTEEKAAVLQLTLSEWWTISGESNCVLEADGDMVTVDLSVAKPVLIIQTEATDSGPLSRAYYLVIEKMLRKALIGGEAVPEMRAERCAATEEEVNQRN